READPEFMPHLSLAYGHLSILEKERMAKSIGKIDLTFMPHLEFWKCDGLPDKWEMVKRLP
ncbi:MAG: hypothetical protein HGA85_08200, partial [Nanoarchaeota archaeon]|nr:hypothetical protein [Nanoarchaeota archaeon]